MNSWLRYFFLFIVVVFLQVTIGNNIHLLGVAIPFLYIYFIIRYLYLLSVNWTLTLAFILGLVIDIFSNTAGYECFGLYRCCLFEKTDIGSLYAEG